MEHQERYNYFYSKYYTKAEFLIKQFLIKRKSQDKVFSMVFNEAFQYITLDYVQKSNIQKNQHLKTLYTLFEKRHSFYANNQEQHIFKNEIKNAFNNLTDAQLPKGYSFTKLITEIAVLQAIDEIARIFANQVQLIGMFYQLNAFEEFKIRTYDPLSLEDSPIFKKLHQLLYPKETSDIDAKTLLNSEPQNVKTTDKRFNRNYWNENCFHLFYYLQDNYDKKGKIKYINIFYFLKNNVDKNKYAFAFTIEQYKDFILTNFDIQLTKFEKAEYEYVEKVIPILSSFEQDFRKNS